MRIGMFGTRGVPASYGGFETAVEEVGVRLVERGHEVIVYCRGPRSRSTYRGMSLVTLPALRRRSLETLSHTALSALHAVGFEELDAAVIFNAANAPLAAVLRAAGVPVAVHVDGLEWKRGKWQGAGRAYYLAAEAISVALADTVIADADEIACYYQAKFGLNCRTITYGAPIVTRPAVERLAELGLRAGEFHLVVARFEPENNVDLIVEAYRRSSARLPLVVVGGNPYPTPYTQRLQAVLAGDDRVMAVGSIYDQELLDALYASALTYSHGHTVGGTNPSLLRAMGAGATILAHDNRFNREVLGTAGLFFTEAAGLNEQFEVMEANRGAAAALGSAAQQRAIERYRWDDVAAAYERLAEQLMTTGPRPRRTGGGGRSRLSLAAALRRAPTVLSDWSSPHHRATTGTLRLEEQPKSRQFLGGPIGSL